MEYMRVTGWEDELIGFGCDGANANMGERSGLKRSIKRSCTMGGSLLVLGSPSRVVLEGCPQNIFL